MERYECKKRDWRQKLKVSRQKVTAYWYQIPNRIWEKEAAEKCFPFIVEDNARWPQILIFLIG